MTTPAPIPKITIPRDKDELLKFAKGIENMMVRSMVVGLVRSMTPAQIESLAEQLEKAVNDLRQGVPLDKVLSGAGVRDEVINKVIQK